MSYINFFEYYVIYYIIFISSLQFISLFLKPTNTNLILNPLAMLTYMFVSVENIKNLKILTFIYIVSSLIFLPFIFKFIIYQNYNSNKSFLISKWEHIFSYYHLFTISSNLLLVFKSILKINNISFKEKDLDLKLKDVLIFSIRNYIFFNLIKNQNKELIEINFKNEDYLNFLKEEFERKNQHLNVKFIDTIELLNSIELEFIKYIEISKENKVENFVFEEYSDNTIDIIDGKIYLNQKIKPQREIVAYERKTVTFN